MVLALLAYIANFTFRRRLRPTKRTMLTPARALAAIGGCGIAAFILTKIAFEYSADVLLADWAFYGHKDSLC